MFDDIWLYSLVIWVMIIIRYFFRHTYRKMRAKRELRRYYAFRWHCPECKFIVLADSLQSLTAICATGIVKHPEHIGPKRPCEGGPASICTAEGCFGDACVKGIQ